MHCIVYPRRRFLKELSLAAVSLTTVRGSTDKKVGLDPLSLLSTPVQGAADVKLFPVKNPSLILIHVRQLHESSLVSAVYQKNSSSSPLIQECHEDIRTCIEEIVRRGISPHALYVEGTDETTALSLSSAARDHQQIASSVKEAKSFLIESEKNAKTAALSPDQVALTVDRIRYATMASISNLSKLEATIDAIAASHGTAIRIASRFGIPLRDLETPRTKEILAGYMANVHELDKLNKRFEFLGRTIEDALKGKISISQSQMKSLLEEVESAPAKKKALIQSVLQYAESHKDELFTERENEYVNKLYVQGTPRDGAPHVAVLLLGGEHDLRDNVEALNRGKLEGGCALATITPQRYRTPDERELNVLKNP